MKDIRFTEVARIGKQACRFITFNFFSIKHKGLGFMKQCHSIVLQRLPIFMPM
jgi:hypothetical protein